MADKIQLRRDTSANWATYNPVLSLGEAGFDTDTKILKIGDGSSAWSALNSIRSNAIFIDGNPISAENPNADQFLKWNGSTWVPQTISQADGNATALQTRPISSDVPNFGDVLEWNGSQWTPTALSIVGGMAWDASVSYKTGDIVSLAGTAYVSLSNGNNNNDPTDLAPYWQVCLANAVDSVALTGVPTAPTAEVGNNTTQIATTKFTIENRGDRYLTTSTSSNSISNGTKTFTVQTGLSYIPTQDITVVYDINNHMHGTVTSYNSTTGQIVIDVSQHSGTGTYTAWTINVGGLTSINGALLSANNLSDVANASTSLTNLGGVATSRQVIAGTGLTGGGDLTVNRTLNVDFGSSGTQVCAGNDSRLSDSRTPTGAAGGVLSGTYPNPGFNSTTGTGSTVVLSASPTLTGTLGAASITASGTLAVTGATTLGTTAGAVDVILAGSGAQTQPATASEISLKSTGSGTLGIASTYGKLTMQIGGSNNTILAINGAFSARCSQHRLSSFDDSTGATFVPETAHFFAQRNGTNAQGQRIYNTWTSSTNYERAKSAWESNVLKIGTEKGSAGGTARDLAIQTDGTDRITVGAAGGVTIAGTTTVNAFATGVQSVSASAACNGAAVVLANATSGSVTMTLPAALSGQIITFKKIDSSANTVVITPPGGATIDGQASVTLSVQYQSVGIVSNGTNFFII